MPNSFTQHTPHPAAVTPRQAVSFADRPRPGARAVGSYLPGLTRAAFAKYGFSAASLLTDWAAIVGTDVARYSEPERLKWPRMPAISEEPDAAEQGRPGATLVLRVEAAKALEVQYRGRQLIERINAYFGYRAVDRLRIIQVPGPLRPAATATPAPRPATRRPAPAELAAIADSRLRAALEHMASGIGSRRGS